MNHILFLQLWHLLKYAELSEAVQHRDKTFANVLNSVCVCSVDANIESFLKARFINQSAKDYPLDALDMHVEMTPTVF